MGIIKKKTNQYDTMARVKFNNSFKNISMYNNDDTTNLFQRISAVKRNTVLIWIKIMKQYFY